MTRGFRWAWLLLALFVFVLPSSAQDEKKDAKKTDAKKKDTKKKGDDSDDDSKDTKKKTTTTTKKEDPNRIVPFGAPVIGKLLGTENGKLRLQTKRRVFNGKAYELKDQHVEFELADKVTVRLEALPVAFDEKGKVKKYTKEELAELKGPDKNAFGYTGSMDQLKPEQVLRVYLGKPKSAPKTDPVQVYMIHIAGNGGN